MATDALKNITKKITDVISGTSSEASGTGQPDISAPIIADTPKVVKYGQYILGKEFDFKSDVGCIAYLEELTPGDYTTPYGSSFQKLKLEVKPFTTKIARVKITDAEKTRWEIPQEYVAVGTNLTSEERYPGTAGFKLHLDEKNQDAGFAIIRDSDNVPVFDSRGFPITFTDQYIEFSLKLPENTFIYGLGEVTGPFLRETGHRYAFWSRDAQTPMHQNSYSSMPMFAGMHNGKAFGVYLHNSNALDMIYEEGVMTYKVVGGVLDFFVFLGDTYEDVVVQYQQVVGFPQLPPYWSLGYHQCRWGYKNKELLDQSRKKNMKAKIPVDVFWLDIDYMEDYKLFTLQSEEYPDLPGYVENEMHKDNHKLVAILDPGIKNNRDDYRPWVHGKELDIFIKNGNTGKDFVGKVWPGHVVFPDWIHPKIGTYWTEMLRDWLKIMPVDGIWHDMNEASNFVNGDVAEAGGDADVDDILIPGDDETVEDMAKASADGVEVDETARKTGNAKPKPPPAFDPTRPPGLTNPPYTVNHGGEDWPLNARSISVESTHYGGVLEYNVHNLFGHMNCMTTYNSMLEIKPDERPFILTRSAFAGTGRYASKWLGDNFSHWDSMRWSISGMLNMQLFGVTHIGADIGGFNGSPTTELLLRWFQLGAMYPFCRNHNMPHTPDQEAHVTLDVSNVARTYLTFRYRILPFWYTAFAEANQRGGSVVQPVWAIYPPQDSGDLAKVLKDSNDAFLINKSILVVPIVTAGQTEATAWLPAGLWYDAMDGSVLAMRKDDWMTLTAPIERMPIYFRGGSIIPMHHNKSGMTTVDFRKGGLSLMICLDSDGKAEGSLYADDGKTFSSEKSSIKFFAEIIDEKKRILVRVGGNFGYLATNEPTEMTVREIVVRAAQLEAQEKVIKANIFLGYPQSEVFDL